MSANPNASSDTLSASQQQLLTSVQQLQDAQRDLMHRYSSTTDPTEQKNIMNEMNKNETLRANLLSSSGAAALVQNQALATKRDAATDLTAMTNFVEAELKAARERMEEIQTSRTGKERMIELNTYYGKRFMAQAGVMKIFIYVCVPVLILAVLANAGFLPNYIAGFAIIACIVVGIVYIYGAIHDINRRDKTNFDEYTWEFDPSRVGPIVNPHHHNKRNKQSADAVLAGMGCFDKACCAPPTAWDHKAKQCVFVNDAQGEGSAVKGSAHHNVGGKHAAATQYALLGDLSATAGPTAAPSGAPSGALCWTDANRVLKGQCMGGWTYDGAADTCTAPAGSVASSIQMCSPYNVATMNKATPDGWKAFTNACKVVDAPNCT
jgi:hypothetical protein